jgi:hypothetical protein
LHQSELEEKEPRDLEPFVPLFAQFHVPLSNELIARGQANASILGALPDVVGLAACKVAREDELARRRQKELQADHRGFQSSTRRSLFALN